ncbi:MAG: iron ABC transporter permease [Armatimonadetes bacterium]|nr:iron ABC transporter permease [Armatimonadota bacterium]
MRPGSKVGFAAAVALLISLMLVSLLVGPAGLQPAETLRALVAPASTDPSVRAIVWNARLPRLCLAAGVGAALAVAGAVMQGFFQNPMAEPSIIGVSSGAALGATIAIVSGAAGSASWLSLPGFAFAGALGVTVLVYILSRRGLLLTGIAVASLASALSSLIMIRGQRGDLDLVVFWMLGSLANRGWSEAVIVAAYAAIGIVLAAGLARHIDVLALGDEQALFLGLNVERTRAVLLAVVALLAGSAVSAAGVIGFVGLIVPHVCRTVFGPGHRVLVPASALGGMVTLIAADIVANAAGEVPVGTITALIGCPFFLWLLRRRALGQL